MYRYPDNWTTLPLFLSDMIEPCINREQTMLFSLEREYIFPKGKDVNNDVHPLIPLCRVAGR